MSNQRSPNGLLADILINTDLIAYYRSSSWKVNATFLTSSTLFCDTPSVPARHRFRIEDSKHSDWIARGFNHMTYRDHLLEHLAKYRVSVLGIAEPGVYRYRGEDIPKEHILPKGDSWLNILPSARDQVRIVVKNRRIRLHRYFHHLNSSQAFALNLFVPFFEGDQNASTALLRALGQEGTLEDWEPEAIPVPHEGTNVDVVWKTSNGVQTICEVKLTEADFGPAPTDERHLNKLRDTYRPELEKHLPESCLESSIFCANYQVFRNLWHMLKLQNSVLMFLLPRANYRLWSSLSTTIATLPLAVQQRITVQAVENVLTRLCNDAECDSELRAHADGLREKYLCSDT